MSWESWKSAVYGYEPSWEANGQGKCRRGKEEKMRSQCGTSVSATRWRLLWLELLQCRYLYPQATVQAVLLKSRVSAGPNGKLGSWAAHLESWVETSTSMRHASAGVASLRHLHRSDNPPRSSMESSVGSTRVKHSLNLHPNLQVPKWSTVAVHLLCFPKEIACQPAYFIKCGEANTMSRSMAARSPGRQTRGSSTGDEGLAV